MTEQRKLTLFSLVVLCIAFALSARNELAYAQSYSLLPDVKFQPMDSAGVPFSGGKLYTCTAGTTCPGTPQSTYSDNSGTANANPVVLDSAGRATIYLTSTACYKMVFKTSADVTIWTQDNVCSNLPGSLNGSIVDLSSAQALANKGIGTANTVIQKDSVFTLRNASDLSKQGQFSLAGNTTGTTRTYTLPDVSGTVLLAANSTTVSNKLLDNSNAVTIGDSLLTIENASDITKIAKFSAASISTGTTRTFTLPDTTGNVIVDTATQTLTNKTVTLTGRIQDIGLSTVTANNLTLGAGNLAYMTGNTPINLIDTTGWQTGSCIQLIFTGTPTVKNNFTPSTVWHTMHLAGAADFTAGANDTLSLCLAFGDWYETKRSVNH